MKRVLSQAVTLCLVLTVLTAWPMAVHAARGVGKSAAHYEQTIESLYGELEKNLSELNKLEKELLPKAKNFLTKAEHGLKLKSDVATALDAMKSAATSSDSFERSFQVLVEQVSGFDKALPVPGKKSKSDILDRDLANISATLQSVTKTLSPKEQQTVVDKAREALQGDLAKFKELLAKKLENANDTVAAGRALSKTVQSFEMADSAFMQKYKGLRQAIENLKIANRIARAKEPLPEAQAKKLDSATRLSSQCAIVALRGADSLNKVLKLFNRRNKRVRGTLLDTESRVKKIYARHPGWFNGQRANILIALLILSGSIMYYIYHAQRGAKLFIRRIAGLSALDDAVGRATEMGRPVLFVTGIKDVDDVQTLAGISILAGVAKKTAEYDTELFVPCCMPLAYSMCQEVVKESYLRAGRPDAFSQDNIRYLTSDQFGFVAGVDGIMIREKVAATFYLGKFYAESLILAETGNSIGAIQIAGTAETAQLPFFVAACDYTLIGEELFAASAYLSGEPRLLGSLKGQDVGKAIMIVAIIVGIALQILISYEHIPESLSVARLFIAS